MKNNGRIIRKAISLLLALALVLGVFPGTFFAEEDTGTGTDKDDDSGKADYETIMGMADSLPPNWESNVDPYGYGLNEDFIMNPQQELLVYKINGIEEQTIKSYDTLKSENTGYPLKGAKSTDEYTVLKRDTMSHIRTVAFDPTGSGRKDHIAVIGVYAKDYKNDDTVGHAYVYVMDKNGNSSGLVDLGQARWMSDNHAVGQELNNDYMWDFNSMNFLGITAGDYDGDKKESLVVWACGSSPVLKQVNVTSSNGKITLSVLGTNGYKARSSDDWEEPKNDANGLTHTIYYDSDDQVVENRLSVALGSGDFNGDGVDDLAVLSYLGRVTDGEQEKWGYYYIPMYAVSYGTKGDTTSITAGKKSSVAWVQDTSDGNSHIAPMAAGLAVGDIDGDGKDETVISGIYHEVGGSYWKNNGDRKEVSDPYATVNKKKLVTAIYRGTSRILYEKNMSANRWTHGGDGNNGGYFTDKGNQTTADQSLQQIGVETVAINGKKKAELIFISGDLYSFSNGKLSCVYQPAYFQAVDTATGTHDNKETYIRSMAVGNFDGNDFGYEQIAFVLGYAAEAGVDAFKVTYSIGMIGGIYKDKDGNPTDKASSYYCTDNNSIENNDYYYPSKNSGNCRICDCLNYEICAWDNDSDGGHVRYVRKDFEYTDPEVVAIIQAPPYFRELDGVYSDTSTSYSITTAYSFEKGESNSTSFSLSGVFEVDMDVFEMNLEAGYANDWSKTFTAGLEKSKTYTFTADTDDMVIIYRTPVTIYTYQLEKDGKWSDDNLLMVSFPSQPAYQELTIPKYNAFVTYYNQKCRERAEAANAKLIANGEEPIKEDKIPQLQPIVDQWLGHEGDPMAYMRTTSVQEGRVYLQDTPLTFGASSGSTSFSYAKEHSSTTEETMAFGFNFDLTLLFGVDQAKGGVHTSLNYMHEFSTSTTNVSGHGAECTIGNINVSQLEAAGIPEKTAAQYGYQYQMVMWPSTVNMKIPDEEELMDPNKVGEKITMVTAPVPIYGYALNNVSAAPYPVTDLRGKFSSNSQGGTAIKLNWTDPGTSYHPVGAFAVYQIQKDGSETRVAVLPAGTEEYLFDNMDGRTQYEFIVRTRKSENSSYESVDSNIAYLSIEANAIYSIEFDKSEGQYDIYTVFHMDGSTTELRVARGMGIVSFELTKTEGLVDTYTITCSDGSEFQITVTNGRDGKDGADGEKGETGAQGEKGEKGDKGDTGATGAQGEKGEKGDKGDTGEAGRGIISIEESSSVDNLKTYTITYSDGTVSTFTVYNGRDGVDGKDGKDGADGEKGEKGDTGEKGEKGDTGATGAIGAIGAVGPQGEKGEKGDTGAAGANGKDGVDGKDGADGKDGIDGKNGIDGVGITDVRVQDGDLFVTLSSGEELNVGQIISETRSLSSIGEVKTFYFNTSASEITKLTVGGKELTKDQYSVEAYGDGSLITINEDVISNSGGEIKVVTAAGSETVKATGSGSSVPWSIIYVLLGWNTLLTGGVVALALTRKKTSSKKAAE